MRSARAPTGVIRIGTHRPFAARISAAARLPSPPTEGHALTLQTLGPIVDALVGVRIGAALLPFRTARYHVAPVTQAPHARVARAIRAAKLPQITALLVGRTLLVLTMQTFSARCSYFLPATTLPDLTARLGDVAVALFETFEPLLAP